MDSVSPDYLIIANATPEQHRVLLVFLRDIGLLIANEETAYHARCNVAEMYSDTVVYANEETEE